MYWKIILVLYLSFRGLALIFLSFSILCLLKILFKGEDKNKLNEQRNLQIEIMG